MKCAVIVFPGSNCDTDCFHVWKNVLGLPAEYVFYKEKFSPGDFDLIILPGGFSYGDYLRAGAIARFSPAMDSVYKAAEEGKLILGICNGFQILLEAGLLPGAMMKNKDLKFHCHEVYLKVGTVDSPFANMYLPGEVVKMPVAHGEGNYYADPRTVERLKREDRIVFYYSDEKGNITGKVNPNGSVENIAGILNEKRNILGMMPHPERCAEEILGNTAGKNLFLSILEYLEGRAKVGVKGRS